MYGKRLRELREEKGLSQQQVAEYLHCHQHTVSRYEAEQHEPNFAVLAAYCRLFDVSADYILGLEDEDGRKKYS